MAPEREKVDPLEQAESALYSPEAPAPYEPIKLSQKEFETKETWEDSASGHAEEALPTFSLKKKTVRRIFIGSTAFFFVAIGFAGYRLFWAPLVSNTNVDISLEAPALLAGGEEQMVTITVKNNNRSTIEGATLSLAYPGGVTFPDETAGKDSRLYKQIGALAPGQSRTEKITFIAFGEENEEKAMNLKLEYRIQGSSATFTKEKDYSFVLSTSPLALSLVAPSEVNADEPFVMTIEAVSNAPETLTNVALLLSYPPGFSAISQTPKPTRGNNVWVIGDMKPGDTYKLTFRGKLSGHTEDQKTFTLSVGQMEPGGTTIKTTYNQNTKTITIRQAFVGIDFLCDGNKNEEIAIGDNKEVICEIQWKNNFPTNILNGNFKIAVTGSVIDRGSIKTTGGFYKSDESALYWNQTTSDDLTVIAPQDTGKYTFSFTTVPLLAGAGGTFQNPEIRFDLLFKGDRQAEGQTNEPITITMSKKVKVSSSLVLDSHGLYHIGRFINTGPLPPAVDQKTTYTIVWELTNSSNNVTNGVVTASLPIYTEWLNTVSPFDEDIQFNETTGTIFWNVGNLPAGTGVTSPARQVIFQIGFVPSISQKGSSPTLVSAPQFRGTDSFSRESVRATGSAVTTALTQDPSFNRFEDGEVVE